MSYLMAHRTELTEGLGALYALLCVVNGLLPYNSGKRKWLGYILDRIAPFTRSNATGTFKMPFLASSTDGKSVPPPTPAA